MAIFNENQESSFLNNSIGSYITEDIELHSVFS